MELQSVTREPSMPTIANGCNGDGAVKKRKPFGVSYPVGRRESHAYEI